MCTNQKPWTSQHILKMLEQKQAAHDDGSRKLYNKLKCDISKSITIAKKDYSAKIQQQHMKSFYQAYLQYLVTQCIFKQA